MRLLAVILTAAALLLPVGCSGGGGGNAQQTPPGRVSTAERLKPHAGPVDANWRRGRSYVPVYSSLEWGFDHVLVDLAVTLSIRNVTLSHDVVIESVDYYDSHGARLRQYVESPSRLTAMATVEYLIWQRDRAGGTGANFLVDWAIPPDGEEPLIEAVMVGQHGNAGISFTSTSRTTRRVK